MTAPRTSLYGLMIEFETPEKILTATRRSRRAGYRHMDAYTPYTIEGLSTELGMRRTVQPSVVLIAGLVGASVGYFMQYYSMVIDYPFNVGGRPIHSWPLFVPVTFEMMVLVASFSVFFAFLFANGLPQPNHPVFNEPRFIRASQDRMFLCIEATDPHFEYLRTKAFLESLDPLGEVMLIPGEPRRLARRSAQTELSQPFEAPSEQPTRKSTREPTEMR